MATKWNIIDVSAFNPSVNWSQVERQTSGVILRAGYRGTSGGLTTDHLFLRHLEGALSAKIPRIGVYWWSTQHTAGQAEEDAAYVLNLLAPYGAKINFGVWLDSEAPGTSGAGESGRAFLRLSASERTDCALRFLSAIRQAGFLSGVYASDSWFGERLKCDRLRDYPLWVARYGSQPPELVRHYAGWQYTGTAHLTGVAGEVDRSWFYTDLSEEHDNQREEYNMDTLRTGDRGQQVRALQKLLGGLTVDGIFGPRTRAAVEAYQAQNGLVTDGVVGPKTWGVLLA